MECLLLTNQDIKWNAKRGMSFSASVEAWEALPRLDQSGGLETTCLKFSPVKNTIGTVEISLPLVY